MYASSLKKLKKVFLLDRKFLFFPKNRFYEVKLSVSSDSEFYFICVTHKKMISEFNI